MSQRTRRHAVTLCLLGALVCLGGLLWEQLPYWQADQVYQSYRPQEPSPAPSPPPSTVPKAEGSPPVVKRTGWQEREGELPPGAVAWLRCQGTILDYPVMQGEDNVFYLEHLSDGRKNKLGAIFLDYQANSDFSSEVSVLYGHMARSGRMFACLKNYKTQEYYDEHPVMELYTPQADYQIELLCAYLVDGTNGSYPTGFSTPEEREAYLKEACERSFFQSAFPIEGGAEPLVILSTCSYEFENARLALVGRLKPIPM